MVNSIIDAISIAINDKFGEDYEIYTESIRQGFSEPCFFIHNFSDNNELFVGSKYIREAQFSINYFSNSHDVNKDCNEVASKLYECLEWLNIDGDLIRGTGLKYEIIDGVLNFYVNYKVFYYNTKDQIKMGDITQSTQINKER